MCLYLDPSAITVAHTPHTHVYFMRTLTSFICRKPTETPHDTCIVHTFTLTDLIKHFQICWYSKYMAHIIMRIRCMCYINPIVNKFNFPANDFFFKKRALISTYIEKEKEHLYAKCIQVASGCFLICCFALCEQKARTYSFLGF